MKTKNILLFLLILIMCISPVNAISILSVSEVNFESNNDWYSGPAFVCAGVENGGQDEITWELHELDETLPEGYSVEKSGSITSEFNSNGWDYPMKISNLAFGLKKIGDSTFHWTDESANEWCEGIGGWRAVDDGWTSFYYVCMAFYQRGYEFELSPGTYDYSVDYTMNIEGEGSDSLTITEATSVNGMMIGSKNWFQIVRQTDGTTSSSDPDVDDKISFLYDVEDGEYMTTEPDANYWKVSGDTIASEFSECMGWFQSGYDWQCCLDELDDSYEDWKYGIWKYFDEDKLGEPVVNMGLGTGSIHYDDGNIYRNPIVTLTINADKLGVYREFGTAEFSKVTYPSNLLVGEEGILAIEVKNVADGDMEAYIGFDCPKYEISGINQRFDLDSGDTRSDSGTIRYLGSVEGCSENDSCRLTIQNANLPTIDDEYIFTPKVCQLSNCDADEVGMRTCVGDTVKECTEINGAYQLETVVNCPEGCVVEDSKVFCEGTLSTCSKGVSPFLCEIGEDDPLSDNYCPEDCKKGEAMEDSDLETILMWVLGGLGVLILGFALYVRLKKEGYFKK